MDNFDVRSIERRRRLLRVILFVIILGTLPFYCVGFLLLGTAGQRQTGQPDVLPTVSFTPIGFDQRATSTLSPTPRLLVTITQISPLRPTPRQFNPGGGQPFVPLPTQPFIPPPTAVIIPTSTPAPTLTPFPTAVPPTAVPPTDVPTWTPLPTDPPLPTPEPPTPEPPTAEPPTVEPPVVEPPTAEAGT